MKSAVTITNKKILNEILNGAEFGTLALCYEDKPYSLPLNFVELNGEIFFHGAKNGKKIEIIKKNSNASFSIVEDISLLPSYFSNDKGNACPATHLFKSIIIDGKIEFIEEYEKKTQALQTLMEKLQKEGNYIPLNHEMYKKAINSTCLYKLIPTQTTAKFKLGQNFNEERYERVKEHLLQRGTKKDLATLKVIEEFRK